MKNYIAITFICVLMIYSAKSHSVWGYSHLRLSCTLSDSDLKNKYPAGLSIKVLSDLLRTNVIKRDISQLSVDEVSETSAGTRYTVVDSEKYELNSVSIDKITILYNDEQELHLDRETLEIYILQNLKTTKDTAYQMAHTVYSCSQGAVDGI